MKRTPHCNLGSEILRVGEGKRGRGGVEGWDVLCCESHCPTVKPAFLLLFARLAQELCWSLQDLLAALGKSVCGSDLLLVMIEG
jgi:hypothetical protein